MVLKVATFFARCSGKEQAVKVLEEAAEVFAAWQELEALTALADKGLVDADLLENAELELLDEIADVITAACNLARLYNLDVPFGMLRCEQRNHERGRL